MGMKAGNDTGKWETVGVIDERLGRSWVEAGLEYQIHSCLAARRCRFQRENID